MNTEEECPKGNCIDRDFILSNILLIISKFLPYIADSLILLFATNWTFYFRIAIAHEFVYKESRLPLVRES